MLKLCRKKSFVGLSHEVTKRKKMKEAKTVSLN
jgi:hypothetical protein